MLFIASLNFTDQAFNFKFPREESLHGPLVEQLGPRTAEIILCCTVHCLVLYPGFTWKYTNVREEWCLGEWFSSPRITEGSEEWLPWRCQTARPVAYSKYCNLVCFVEMEHSCSQGERPMCPSLHPSSSSSACLPTSVTSEIPLGLEASFTIDTSESGKAEVQVNIVSPSGRVFPAILTENPNGFVAKFTPQEVGRHTINVVYAGKPVPQSPLTTEATLPEGAAPTKGDAGKVKAYGPGLTGGVAEQPAKFTVDTSEAGPGSLGLTIEGPVEAKIECVDRGNNKCDVCYWPTVPGEYAININFADNPIPHSPYKAQIAPSPSAKVDVSKVTAYGPGLQPTGKCPVATQSGNCMTWTRMWQKSIVVSHSPLLDNTAWMMSQI